MKYLTRTSFDKIKSKYDNIIGWGYGPLLFMNYSPFFFEMDFLVDGTGKKCGIYYKGIIIKSSDSIRKLQGQSLIIIYTIYEKEIVEQIGKYKNDNIDVIICSLLDIRLVSGNFVTVINGKSCEDMLILMLTRQLGLETVQFLEVGVCHPIMRNNTYLLYEQFSHMDGYRGILVEANPLCWDLITEYRPEDILIKKGIGNCKGKSIFYAFPNLLGHSTFVKEAAQEKISKGYICEKIEVETERIDNIIDQNFDRIPDILAIDAEGLDFEILSDWNHEKYPIRIIISEIMEEKKYNIEQLMDKKGYRFFAKTLENIIWVKKTEQLYF